MVSTTSGLTSSEFQLRLMVTDALNILRFLLRDGEVPAVAARYAQSIWRISGSFRSPPPIPVPRDEW